MKNRFLAILALLIASSAMAQTKFEEGTLKEAIVKAKAENKMIMIIASATW